MIDRNNPLNRFRIDRIIRESREYRLPGWGDGSAFCCHPCWIRRGQLLLVSHWHVDDTCHVSVITDPEAVVRAGMDNSRAHGDPWPVVNKGEIVLVWDDRFRINGPWEAALPKLLDELEAEIAAAKEKLRLKQEAEQALREQQRLDHESKVRAAFSA